MPKKFYDRSSWKNPNNGPHCRSTNGQTPTFVKKTKFEKYNDKKFISILKEHCVIRELDLIDMGTGEASKFKRSVHRLQSPASEKKLRKSAMSWYTVTLPFGNKYDKQFLLKTLEDNLSALPFWPILWNATGSKTTFYVDNYEVAEKLYSLDGNIFMPDGDKIIIKVKFGKPPMNMNTELKEKMKQAMSNRYNAANKALDLTKFHADPILQNYYCALNEPRIFVAVFDIISENIPDIEALNLNDNNISLLAFLLKFVSKLDKIKILYLQKNRITLLGMLEYLKRFPLEELCLEGNPICDKFNEKSMYIRCFHQLCNYQRRRVCNPHASRMLARPLTLLQEHSLRNKKSLPQIDEIGWCSPALSHWL